MSQKNEYQLLDSGQGKKLEQFGKITLIRPAAQALWQQRHPELWQHARAAFDRVDGLNWHGREKLPESWVVFINGIRMKLSTTDFGHIGVFPETRALWDWIGTTISSMPEPASLKVLNLFAYSGGATLAAARAGAQVCHLDASRGMVDWARENSALNGLTDAPIRWVVDDVGKFLAREQKRNNRYDAIILDPPSFGRGKKGELYKIEKDLLATLKACRELLSSKASFVLLSSHTPGLTPLVLQNILESTVGTGLLECGEMLLTGNSHTLALPSGTWARWMPSK